MLLRKHKLQHPAKRPAHLQSLLPPAPIAGPRTLRGRMKQQINRLIESATQAYEFAPGSYTWFALMDAITLRNHLDCGDDWIAQWLEWSGPPTGGH
jgi:hypothetical protein